jgi:hypothetical protein
MSRSLMSYRCDFCVECYINEDTSCIGINPQTLFHHLLFSLYVQLRHQMHISFSVQVQSRHSAH